MAVELCESAADVVAHRGGVGVAILALELEGAVDDARKGLTHLGGEGADAGGGEVRHLRHQLHGARALLYAAAGAHAEPGRPEGEQIRATVDLVDAARGLLG